MDDFANASNLTSSAAARGLPSWCGWDGSWSFASAVGGFVSLMAVLAGCASSSPNTAEDSGHWCRAINASGVLEITRSDMDGTIHWTLTLSKATRQKLNANQVRGTGQEHFNAGELDCVVDSFLTLQQTCSGEWKHEAGPLFAKTVEGGLQVYGYCSAQTFRIGRNGAKTLGFHPSDSDVRRAAIR